MKYHIKYSLIIVSPDFVPEVSDLLNILIIKMNITGRETIDSNEDGSWRKEFMEKLRDCLKDIDLKLIDPSIRTESIEESYSIFAQDCFFVANCDFVVVQGKDKQGIGTGIEMLTAKMHGVPVIAVVPKKSYYRLPDKEAMKYFTKEKMDNWIHPFMSSLSDVIVEDLDTAAAWIKEHLNEKKQIKDVSVINEAIEYYKKHHYEKDEQAKDAFS